MKKPATSSSLPLFWHKQCLAHWEENLLARQRELADLQLSVEKSRTELDFYRTQIAAAEFRQMAAFDSERLLKPRRKPTGDTQ